MLMASGGVPAQLPFNLSGSKSSLSGIAILAPACSYDIPSLQLLILRSAGFPLEPSFGSAKRQLSRAEKIQNREILSFQCIPQNTSPTPPPWSPNFAASIASLYPLATLSALIRPTILPNRRRVRWPSASISQ